MTELERQIGVVREAPEDLLRELRLHEPSSELLHMGGTAWLLGRIRPTRPLYEAGVNLAASTNRAIRGRKIYGTDRRRWKFAQARMRGFLPIAEYSMRDPDARVVRDLEVMTFLYHHTSDEDMLLMSERDKLKAQAEARADLTDPGRATDAWHYMFTRSHAVTRSQDPGPKAGRIRHPLTHAGD